MPSHMCGIMWNVGGAERCGESEAFSLFASYRAVGRMRRPRKQARYGKIRYFWMEDDSRARTNASTMSVWTKREAILKE